MVALNMPTSYGYGLGLLNGAYVGLSPSNRQVTKAQHERAQATRMAGLGYAAASAVPAIEYAAATNDTPEILAAPAIPAQLEVLPNMDTVQGNWTAAHWAELQLNDLDGVWRFPGDAGYEPDGPTTEPASLAIYDPMWRRDLSLPFHWWFVDHYSDPVYNSFTPTGTSLLMGFKIRPGRHRLRWHSGETYYFDGGLHFGYAGGSVNELELYIITNYEYADPSTGLSDISAYPIISTLTTDPPNTLTLFPRMPAFDISDIDIDLNGATIKRNTMTLKEYEYTYMYATLQNGSNTATDAVMADEFQFSWEPHPDGRWAWWLFGVHHVPSYAGSPDYPLTEWIGNIAISSELAVRGISDGSTVGVSSPMPPHGGFLTGDNLPPVVFAIVNVPDAEGMDWNWVLFTTQYDWNHGQLLSGTAGARYPYVKYFMGKYSNSGDNRQHANWIAIMRPDRTLGTTSRGTALPVGTSNAAAGFGSIFYRPVGTDAATEYTMNGRSVSFDNATKTFVASSAAKKLPDASTGGWGYGFQGVSNTNLTNLGRNRGVEGNPLPVPALPDGVMPGSPEYDTWLTSFNLYATDQDNIGATSTLMAWTPHSWVWPVQYRPVPAPAIIPVPNLGEPAPYRRIYFKGRAVADRKGYADGTLVRFLSVGTSPYAYPTALDVPKVGTWMTYDIFMHDGFIDGGNATDIDRTYSDREGWHSIYISGAYNITFTNITMMHATGDNVSLLPKSVNLPIPWAHLSHNIKFTYCHFGWAGRHHFVYHGNSDTMVDHCTWDKIARWVFDNESNAAGKMLRCTFQYCYGVASGALGFFGGEPSIQLTPADFPRIYTGCTLKRGKKMVTTNSSEYTVQGGKSAGSLVTYTPAAGGHNYIREGTYIIWAKDATNFELSQEPIWPATGETFDNITLNIGCPAAFRDFKINHITLDTPQPFHIRWGWALQQASIAEYATWTKYHKTTSPYAIVTLTPATPGETWVGSAKYNRFMAYLTTPTVTRTIAPGIPSSGSVGVCGVGPATWPANAYNSSTTYDPALGLQGDTSCYRAMSPDYTPPPLLANQILIGRFPKSTLVTSRTDLVGTSSDVATSRMAIPSGHVPWTGFTVTNISHVRNSVWHGVHVGYSINAPMIVLNEAWTEVTVNNNDLPAKLNAAGVKVLRMLGWRPVTGARVIVPVITGPADYRDQATINNSALPILNGVTQQWNATGNNFNNALDDQTAGDPIISLSLYQDIDISNPDDTVTFTANLLYGGSEINNKLVSFYYSFFGSPVLLGSQNTNVSGEAVFTTSTLAIGTHYISATFVGDDEYSGVTSNEVIHIVTDDLLLETATEILELPVVVSKGTILNIVVNVTSAAASDNIITGNVTFYENDIELSIEPVLNGQCSITHGMEVAGDRAIAATYSGDAIYDTSNHIVYITVTDGERAKNTYNTVIVSAVFDDPKI